MDFRVEFEDSLSKNQSIIFSAHCNISYSGRAESILPWGDRIIIIKQDKTLLVHQKQGSAPVNYMKEASFSVDKDGDYLVLLAEDQSRKEFMRIEMTQVHFFHSQDLKDEEKIRLVGSERDMADMIVKNPKLIADDFSPLSREEHTKFGFIDVFGHDKNGTLVIVECKRYAGDLAAVTQLRRYVEKVKAAKGVDKVRGILACPKISKNSLEMLEKWGFEYIPIAPPKFLERFDKSQTKLL